MNPLELLSALKTRFAKLHTSADIAAYALNHALRQSPDLLLKTQAQAGKTVCLQIDGWSIRLTIDVAGLLAAVPAELLAADATISLPAAALPLIMADPSQAMSKAHVSGQADLAALASHLFKHLRWDAEDDLAHLIGNDAAVHGVRLANKLKDGLHGGVRRLLDSGREYAVYEKRWLVSQEALTDWTAEVRTLRDDVARLEKRIERLMGKPPA